MSATPPDMASTPRTDAMEKECGFLHRSTAAEIAWKWARDLEREIADRTQLAQALSDEVESLRRNGGHDVSQIVVDLMAQAAAALRPSPRSETEDISGLRQRVTAAEDVIVALLAHNMGNDGAEWQAARNLLRLVRPERSPSVVERDGPNG